MITPHKETKIDPFMGHGGRNLSKHHRGDPKGGEMNSKEFRYYEAKDMIIPNIL